MTATEEKDEITRQVIALVENGLCRTTKNQHDYDLKLSIIFGGGWICVTPRYVRMNYTNVSLGTRRMARLVAAIEKHLED